MPIGAMKWGICLQTVPWSRPCGQPRGEEISTALRRPSSTVVEMLGKAEEEGSGGGFTG